MADNLKDDKYSMTLEQKTIAIELATEGKSIKSILCEICVSNYFFYKAKEYDSFFAKRFEQARQEGLEHLADDLIDIADDLNMDVQRARLKSDNSKWLLSKRKPETYGDKIELNVTQTIDIAKSLADAKARIVGSVALEGKQKESIYIDENADEIVLEETDKDIFE